MVSSFLLAATLGLVFVLHRIIGALRILRSVELEFHLLAWLLVESWNCYSYLPGIWTVFSLRSILYHLLPPIPWIKLNRNHIFEEGHKSGWSHLQARPVYSTSFREFRMGCLFGGLCPSLAFPTGANPTYSCFSWRSGPIWRTPFVWLTLKPSRLVELAVRHR